MAVHYCSAILIIAMELYIFEKYHELYPEVKGKALTDKLIQCALEEYGVCDGVIERTDDGKPYVSNHQDLYISVSHSGGVLACLVGDAPLGVDIQETRKVRAGSIAKRYFTQEERVYMEDNGESGFFMLWTRKEAYAKYIGTGLKEIIAGTTVLGRDDVEFHDFRLGNGIYGSWCVKLPG